MQKHRIDEETGHVLFASVAVWAAVVGAAAVEGVFAKFDAGAVAAFAVGVALYALAAYRIDREMHAYITRFSGGWIAIAALASAGAFAVASLFRIPALALFAAPLAAVACAAALKKLSGRPGATRATAKSPGATPAAT